MQDGTGEMEFISPIANIDRGLGDPPLPPEVGDYYASMCDRMKDYAEASRRTVLSLLLVAAAIELLSRAAISGVQIGPFELSDLSLIRKVLPALAAYLIYDLMDTGFRYTACRRVAIQINHKYRPGLLVTRLAALSFPQLSPVFGNLPWHRRAAMPFRIIGLFVRSLRFGGIAFAAFLEALWIAQLFTAFGLHDPVVWAAALLSAAFLCFAVLLAWEAQQSGHFRFRPTPRPTPARKRNRSQP